MWSFFSRDPSKEFNYDILEPVQETSNYLWRLHKGKKKSSGEAVSIFVYDLKLNGQDIHVELARSAIKRLKTLRHPNILTYVDSLETEKNIYLITEYVEPLTISLNSYNSHDNKKSIQQKELFIAWGLFQVTRALSFLINDGHLQHNCVNMANIFVNSAGEWKLAGLELAAPPSQTRTSPGNSSSTYAKYTPPELLEASKFKSGTNWSTDMWGFGCLIWEVFNGIMKSSASLQKLGTIPKQLVPVYCELVGANPGLRPNPKDVLSKCRKPGGYFQNDLVECLLFLEEIQIKEDSEKSKFFNSLPSLLDSFPENLSRHKILPQLINAFEFGNAGSSILTPLFKMGSLLNEEEYQKRIVPCIVKLFSSPDRVTRVRLLQQLENVAVHLLPSTVNDQIFPQIINGFLDSNPTIREHTVKCILHLAPKLNYNNLNVEVLKHFARLQAKDEQGGIRTNTTVCLGKVASHLHPQVRQKVLVSAFTRALRDPFPPARIGGILAFAATQHYYMLTQISQQILPAMCVLTNDPEREVREQAFKVIKGFLTKLEKVSEDPSLKETMEADVNANASPNVTDVASTWAGWAVSAVTSKFYKSQPNKAVDQPSSQQTDKLASGLEKNLVIDEPNDLKESQDRINDGDVSWDSMTWGDINPMPSASKSSKQESQEDLGWEIENEEWDSIETSQMTINSETSKTKSTQSKNGPLTLDDHPSPWDSSNKSKSKLEENQDVWESGWNEASNWQSATHDDLGKNEARRQREEKRIQRQKELEAKRNSRIGGNSGMQKLGVKKN